MDREVIEVLQSFHFPQWNVIVTKCQHRHLRPPDLTPKVGEMFFCGMCDDETPGERAMREASSV